MNYGGLNNLAAIYLMKTRDFCLFQANLPPRMAFLLTFGHNEIGQMAEFDRQRTHDTTRNIFLPKIRDIGGLFGQELRKLIFSYVFHTFPIVKCPKTHKLFSLFLCKDSSLDLWQFYSLGYGSTSDKNLRLEYLIFLNRVSRHAVSS